MTKQEIYAEILTAISTLKDTKAAGYWQNYLSKENCTGNSVRKSVIFPEDTATILYALKLDLESDMHAEQAKLHGRKNYSAVKRFMTMCEKESKFKPFFSVAHERNGQFFASTAYIFYLSNYPDGLTFAPENCPEESTQEIDCLYDNIANHFDTNGTAYKIPYTIAQLKAWRKSTKKQRIPFSLSYALPLTRNGEQHYAAINVDFLILAMEIGYSLTLENILENIMENNDSDQREILRQRYFDGLSWDCIADHFGFDTTELVKEQHRKALKKIHLECSCDDKDDFYAEEE